MADDPPDPLFSDVEEWRAEFDEPWFDWFVRVVIVGFALVIALMVIFLVIG